MPRTSFEIDVPEISPNQTLLVGLTSPGMAGITAADYLVRHHEATEIGHISPDELPAITPVAEGKPRHHTRLYNLHDMPFTVLVGELFVPAWAARSFADALIEWAQSVEIEEVALLHAVPFPHGPDDHAIFHIATPEYEDRRIDESITKPMRGGFLDGVPGELVSRSLTGDAPPVGVYTTPAHPPGPDADAALLFLDAIESIYDISIDLTELENLSDEIQKHFTALAEHMEALESESRAEQEFGADRMFM